ncbi:hypothetical protein [Anaerotignum propionicum]|uniref:hypothetical protein n=1 Tax=Anaerotignum propionicum TaxID=28446 RepID=UPI002109C202|nr:hypothetical protein [Anaerotignum propionicum]MCQ4936303.1 hypothetical protein [Anaerotignum propionicum]
MQIVKQVVVHKKNSVTFSLKNGLELSGLIPTPVEAAEIADHIYGDVKKVMKLQVVGN